jgi:hypothetical protein
VTELDSVPNGWSTLRKFLTIVASVVAIFASLPATFYFLHVWSNKPLCNKQTLFQVMNWFDNKKSIDLPNVRGSSTDSLIELKKDAYDNEKDFTEDINKWNEKYQYVPGLRKGDPGDLVLMYLKSPTRWNNHASGPPSIFRERKWILVPFDFMGAGISHCAEHVRREVADESEDAERVSLEELKSRLRKTLDYLQKNNRPNWQKMVTENEEFLNSLEAE